MGIGNSIQRLLSRKKKSIILKRSAEEYSAYRKIFGIQYGPSQEQAIAEAIRSLYLF